MTVPSLEKTARWHWRGISGALQPSSRNFVELSNSNILRTREIEKSHSFTSRQQVLFNGNGRLAVFTVDNGAVHGRSPPFILEKTRSQLSVCVSLCVIYSLYLCACVFDQHSCLTCSINFGCFIPPSQLGCKQSSCCPAYFRSKATQPGSAAEIRVARLHGCVVLRGGQAC